ncbi:MAG TPA: RluA family pseudouridine synthase, partial [Beijerinckiaceae bacterium]
GKVKVDGRVAADAGAKVRAGQTVAIDVPEPAAAEPVGEDIPLDVVYEDEHLIVIDKPAGLVVHPAAGHESGTLVNALIAHCGASLSGLGGVRRPGVVHRLDKDTSGLLVVAKTDAAHQGLAALFADHGRTLPLTRAYKAIVWGAPERARGVVDAPIGRHGTHREKQAIVRGERGREAVTHWAVEETFAGADGAPVAALVACELETGRTHQIRVHMAHIGHPVMGDPLYASGFRTKGARLGEEARAALQALGRQALHAETLGFEHPATGEWLEFQRDPPADMQALLAALRG